MDSGNRCQCLFERRRVFDVQCGDGGVFAEDLAVEAGEDFAGAYFDEVGRALGGQELDALDPADGAGDLADEAVAGVVGFCDESGVDVGGDGDERVLEGEGGEVFGEGVLRGLHEGAVEGCADLKHDGALGSGLFAEVGGEVDGAFGAGDDGLVGGVEIGGGDDGESGVEGLCVGGGGERSELVGCLVADLVDEGGGEAEDSGHGSLTCGDGLLHVAAAVADGADGVGEVEGSSGDMSGVLTEGVAGGEGGEDTLVYEDAGGGYRDSEDGGLGVLGELELVFRALEDELRELKVESGICLREGSCSDRVVIVEVAAHAYDLRTLAGEEEDFHVEDYRKPRGRDEDSPVPLGKVKSLCQLA